MISRSVALTILAVLLIGALIYACNTEAQTAPTWIGTDLTAGKQVVAGGGSLSMLQVVESAAWTGTFWGRNWEGSWTRISPQTGSALTDTLLSADGTTPYFVFTGIRVEVIVTTSGTATFWGE